MSENHDEWVKYVKMISSMSCDMLIGRGQTKQAYLWTLRHAADEMEKMIPKKVKGVDDGCSGYGCG